jgi:hypothetical protein
VAPAVPGDTTDAAVELPATTLPFPLVPRRPSSSWVVGLAAALAVAGVALVAAALWL